jgi:hypothetical protein
MKAQCILLKHTLCYGHDITVIMTPKMIKITAIKHQLNTNSLPPPLTGNLPISDAAEERRAERFKKKISQGTEVSNFLTKTEALKVIIVLYCFILIIVLYCIILIIVLYYIDYCIVLY